MSDCTGLTLPCGCKWTPGIDLPTTECHEHAGRGMDRYERRNAEMVLQAQKAVLDADELKGKNIALNGFGVGDGTFKVIGATEPDENGTITLTLEEIR